MTNPYAPPTAVVNDVVVRTDAVLAERLTRFGANILDAVIFGAMVYLPLVIGVITTQQAPGNPLEIVGPGVAMLGFIVWAGFTLRYMARNGQSIAKKLFGIKVVRKDGSPASLARLFWLRNIVNIALSFIPLYAFADALAIFTETQQCLHDRIADTIVIQA